LIICSAISLPVPQICDFGLAREERGFSGLLNTSNPGVSTEGWKSPEQCLKMKITKAVDVYSFGLIAVKLLTGELLWDGKTSKGQSEMFCKKPVSRTS
jgi:serine/threonine protein kinase